MLERPAHALLLHVRQLLLAAWLDTVRPALPSRS